MREHASRVTADATRALEGAREARLSAVRLVRLGRRGGLTREEVGRDLGVQEGTLGAWERRWRRERLTASPRGRPPSAGLTREQRQIALHALHESDGRIGVRNLMLVLEPPAARSAVVDFKARWRRAAHRRGGRLCALLEWTRPGAVWAMDWTDPDEPLEGGLYRKILVVRDLGSGRVLLAQALPSERGRAVADALERLIAKYGAPAVIKCDNGGSLTCRLVRLVLEREGILSLVSPPGCPGYNGACEAGIGSLKARVHLIATSAGRTHEWTCDHVERARVELNNTPRRCAVSAEDRWSVRRPISARERDELWQLYRCHQAAEREARGIALDAQLARLQQSSVDRSAIARACTEVGLVRFRTRRIHPPIRGRKARRIS